MRKIALVCCYGPYIQERSDIERQGLLQYYDGVAKKLLSHLQSGELQAIVLCWGYTITSVWSEAETTRNIFQWFFWEFADQANILLETSSLNTPENLAFGYLTARKYDPEGIVCCSDEYRAEKVRVEAAELFGDRFELDFVTAPRLDTHPNSNLEIQTKEKLPHELYKMDFESLRSLVKNR